MTSSRQTMAVLFWVAMACAIAGFFSMFLAFCSPYWLQSWRRVHSPFANTGMWTICLSGYIKPMDPKLAAYVGCWWIHTSVFHDIANAIMPPWFRVVQFFVVITTLCDFVALLLLALFPFKSPRQSVYGEKPWKMLFAVSIILLVSTLFVFIDSMMFAIITTESRWMPRPYLNYLSWSFGFNVLSAFFTAFAGICTFFLAMIMKEELEKRTEEGEVEEREAGVDNAGVTATPPPPKFKSLPSEHQPMPQKFYGPPPQFHELPPQAQPYQAQPYQAQPYQPQPYQPQPYHTPGLRGSPVIQPNPQPYQGATYAYQRRSQPLDDSNDTEV